MRQIVQSIWWWLRVGVIVVIGLYALLSLWNNSGKSLTVWYWFGKSEETSIVALAVASFLAGVIICTTMLALFTATLRYRRTREHRRTRAIAEHRETLSKKAAMLRTKPAPRAVVRAPKEPPRETAIVPVVVEREIVVKAPPPPRVEKPITKIEPAVVSEPPILVETHRATPFAQTPAIDPTAKGIEPLPIVDQPKG